MMDNKNETIIKNSLFSRVGGFVVWIFIGGGLLGLGIHLLLLKSNVIDVIWFAKLVKPGGSSAHGLPIPYTAHAWGIFLMIVGIVLLLLSFTLLKSDSIIVINEKGLTYIPTTVFKEVYFLDSLSANSQKIKQERKKIGPLSWSNVEEINYYPTFIIGGVGLRTSKDNLDIITKHNGKITSGCDYTDYQKLKEMWNENR
ncbi:hypothetical protein [Lactococcus kimchii]|uniref:hypothetical protein n=1 Tax=Lactococcus sp. S-13 TaxID=2507158 RepID=UPI001022D606|nr:hypothetical protein [Lactococcus sp. S-13]RZI49628.1 hypothetical protein EQJ87_09440 [Lactococcus sp. S-13]